MESSAGGQPEAAGFFWLFDSVAAVGRADGVAVKELSAGEASFFAPKLAPIQPDRMTNVIIPQVMTAPSSPNFQRVARDILTSQVCLSLMRTQATWSIAWNQRILNIRSAGWVRQWSREMGFVGIMEVLDDEVEAL